METGYWGEDIYYSVIVPASPILKNISWAADTLDSIKHSMLVGRFYPITPLITALVFIIFQSVVLYKAYIIAVMLLDVSLFYVLIRRLTGRRSFAAFAAAMTVTLFQFRLTVDPILAYYGQIEWVAAAFFLSLIWLRRHLEEGKPIWLTLSALCYLACTLTYEMTYTLVAIPLLFIAQARMGWRAGVAMARPFVGSAGGCAGMTVLIRWLHPSENYVHQTDFHLASTLSSLWYQISASLPLSYYLADPLQLFSKGRGLGAWIDWVLQPGVILVFFAAAALIFRNLRRAGRTSSANLRPVNEWTLVALGLMLVVCPAILTAISPHHRHYISFGVGWISVMVEYYGMGLLLALGFWRLVASRRLGGSFARRKCLGTAILMASVLSLTYRANIEVATAINAPPGSDRFRQFAAIHGSSWHLQRMNLELALKSGVMDDIPHGSRLQLANFYPFWHDSLYGSFFYTTHARKPLRTDPSQIPSQPAPDAPLFRVREFVRDRKIGVVLVTPAGVALSGSPLASPDSQGRIFVHHPGLRPTSLALPRLLLVGQTVIRAGFPERTIPRVLELGRDLSTVRVGPGWGLFTINLRTTGVDPDSLRLVDDPIQVASWLQSMDSSAAIVTDRPGSAVAR